MLFKNLNLKNTVKKTKQILHGSWCRLAFCLSVHEDTIFWMTMKCFDVLGNFILLSPHYSKSLKDKHGSQGHYDLIFTIDLAELLGHT